MGDRKGGGFVVVTLLVVAGMYLVSSGVKYFKVQLKSFLGYLYFTIYIFANFDFFFTTSLKKIAFYYINYP
jgi:hypothetical protein